MQFFNQHTDDCLHIGNGIQLEPYNVSKRGFLSYSHLPFLFSAYLLLISNIWFEMKSWQFPLAHFLPSFPVISNDRNWVFVGVQDGSSFVGRNAPFRVDGAIFNSGFAQWVRNSNEGKSVQNGVWPQRLSLSLPPSPAQTPDWFSKSTALGLVALDPGSNNLFFLEQTNIGEVRKKFSFLLHSPVSPLQSYVGSCSASQLLQMLWFSNQEFCRGRTGLDKSKRNISPPIYRLNRRKILRLWDASLNEMVGFFKTWWRRGFLNEGVQWGEVGSAVWAVERGNLVYLAAFLTAGSRSPSIIK